MKVRKLIRMACAAILLSPFALTNLHGQTTTNGAAITAITTACPFLMIAPDSRSGALGDAGVAITDNSNATHWNLSALAFTEKKMGIGLSYTPWLRQLVPDINLSYLSGYYNLGEKGGVITGSLRYFTLGRIEFTDINAVKTGEFNANEFAVDAGYTRKVSEVLSAGVALRFIYSNLAGSGLNNGLETKPGTSIAGDVNTLYVKDFTTKSGGKEVPLTLKIGANISNIGAKISYTNSSNRNFIPTNLRVGALLKGGLDAYNSLGVTVDANKLLVPSEGGQSDKSLLAGMFSSFGDAQGGFKEEMQEINLSTGLEYWYNDLIAIRSGLFLENKLKGNRKYVTLGAGVRYNVFGLDFAYLVALQQNHPLQNTLRFSLTLDFESGGNQN